MMTGLLIPVGIATAGFTVDATRAMAVKQELQHKLDAALLSGARATPGERVAVSENFLQNQLREGVEVDLDISENGNSLTGTVVAEVPAYFGGLIGMSSLSVNVESGVTIHAKGGTTTAGSGGKMGCILLMSPDRHHALTVNSGATVNAPDCELHVHSGSNSAAAFNSGIDLDLAKICVAGSDVTNNAGTVDGLEKNCTPLDDPFAGTLPVPDDTSCDFQNQNYQNGTVSLEPGVYCGWTNFNGVDVDFAPGLYVIKGGGWNVNGGDWTGTGVTFYYEDRSVIQFNSAVKADLTPPGDGDYAGLIMFEKPGLGASNFILNDTRGFTLTGLMHLPSRDVTINSGNELQARSMTMVFNSLILNDMDWTLTGGLPGIDAGTGEIIDGTSEEEQVTYGVVSY